MCKNVSMNIHIYIIYIRSCFDGYWFVHVHAPHSQLFEPPVPSWPGTVKSFAFIYKDNMLPKYIFCACINVIYLYIYMYVSFKNHKMKH